MRILSRTYPPPDSDAPNIGPLERARAVLKHACGLEPDLGNPRHPGSRREVVEATLLLRRMYENTSEDRLASDLALMLSVVSSLGGRGSEIVEGLENSLRQEIRRRAGEPLAPATLPTLSSGPAPSPAPGP